MRSEVEEREHFEDLLLGFLKFLADKPCSEGWCERHCREANEQYLLAQMLFGRITEYDYHTRGMDSEELKD